MVIFLSTNIFHMLKSSQDFFILLGFHHCILVSLSAIDGIAHSQTCSAHMVSAITALYLDLQRFHRFPTHIIHGTCEPVLGLPLYHKLYQF